MIEYETIYPKVAVRKKDGLNIYIPSFKYKDYIIKISFKNHDK